MTRGFLFCGPVDEEEEEEDNDFDDSNGLTWVLTLCLSNSALKNRSKFSGEKSSGGPMAR